MKKRILINTMMAAGLLLMAGCGAKKAAVKGPAPAVDAQTSATAPATKTTVPDADAVRQAELQKANFLQRVTGNAVGCEFVSSKISLNIKSGSKDITVPGILRMKKDDVIRIHVQIPVLGSEVGRLEFTKDYVLIVDRMHKQYFKADYNQVEFLKRHGLTFSSMQALFWNELFAPGYDTLTEKALQQFDVTLGKTTNTSISLKDGNLSCLWHADNRSALIADASVAYNSKQSGNTKLTVKYDDFRQLGMGQFPAKLGIGMTTTAGKGKSVDVNIAMNNPSNNGDWETRTEVSKKYKEVSVDDVLKILTNL